MKSHEEIEGWFTYKDTYDFLVSSVPDGGVFVECGAWLGASSSYLCDVAKDRIRVFVVDTWLGSPNEPETFKLASSSDAYKVFLENMGGRKFTPMRMESAEASAHFEDGSCDVVYIDMTHTYEAVKRDIELWLPKVRPGGHIAGHDYADYAPDVVRAVNERFGDRVKVMDGCSWLVKNDIP